LRAHPPNDGSSACTTQRSSSQQALFNTVFHAGTTIAWQEYSPGIITSLTLFLPLWRRLTRLALDDGLSTARGAVLASAIGGTIHAGAVARQVFFIGVPEARRHG